MIYLGGVETCALIDLNIFDNQIAFSHETIQILTSDTKNKKEFKLVFKLKT